MGLKELLQDYLDKPAVSDRFDRDPPGVFAEYGIDEDFQRALIHRDEAAIGQRVDAGTVAMLRNMERLRRRAPPTYPDPDLKIVRITAKDPIVAGQLLEFTIELSWDFLDIPPRLPSTTKIIVREDGNADPIQTIEAVPILVDLEGMLNQAGGSDITPLVVLRKGIKFDKPGTYLISVELVGIVASTVAVPLTVKPAP